VSVPQGTTPQRSKRRKPTRQKHVPIRTCVACRETGAKRGLTRIVRSPEGEVAIDPTGKRNGRGAYLCEKPGCWDRALSSPLLSRALNSEIAPDTVEQLKEFAVTLHTSSVQLEAADSKESAQ
jgi:predicted RNA-binding protein YlxR (DUF448 family)